MPSDIVFVACNAQSAARIISGKPQVETDTAATPADKPGTEQPFDATEPESVPTRCLRVRDVCQFFGGGVLGSNTVAMSTPIVLGRLLRARDAAEVSEELDPVTEILEGRLTSPTGVPWAFGMDWTKIPLSQLQDIYHQRLASSNPAEPRGGVPV